jgi:AbrB family looped-hinge helix DNA binding protein
LEFYGSATVGERGQVVLPIELRKKIQLEAGEKLIVMGTEGESIVLLLKADFLTHLLSKMEKGQNELRKYLMDDPLSVEVKDNEIETK